MENNLVKALEALKGGSLSIEERNKIEELNITENDLQSKVGPIDLILKFWEIVIDIIKDWTDNNASIGDSNNPIDGNQGQDPM